MEWRGPEAVRVCEPRLESRDVLRDELPHTRCDGRDARGVVARAFARTLSPALSLRVRSCDDAPFGRNERRVRRRIDGGRVEDRRAKLEALCIDCSGDCTLQPDACARTAPVGLLEHEIGAEDCACEEEHLEEVEGEHLLPLVTQVAYDGS